ncbi:molybdopterin-binding protein [Vannielia litorea]|uniref:Molybdenum cofactor cytidylyltransferase n=1 Tax=Vannielia litorea TaxID=1217970 RepID=A0A1N6FTA7_9RHOB|nr:molybdopterin-binding protein [Vannielia litorea]SIN98470.1 molybdenum cofactor cytidylyltransferase [Vannielia litorea]
MKFGPVPLREALGAVLAHSVRAGGRVLKKGAVLGPEALAALEAEGLGEVIVARLEPGDVAENVAAEALAKAVQGAGLTLTAAHTGRVNLKAKGPGVLVVDAARVQAINAVDPGITLATLAPYTRVTPGLLAGTVKMIPYAVPAAALEAACAVAAGAMRVAPVVLGRAAVVLTEVPGQKSSITEKGRAAVVGRLDALGIAVAAVEVVAHEPGAVAQALGRLEADLVLILTGSATSDTHDVAPQALREAGGRVDRFGMPVDPGNLLFLGALPGEVPVIGLPGCARSPALNGADWVLERVACGMAPGPDAFAAMGVGGLLKEIPIRPQPREGR